MSTLHLNLKRKWFDLILSGEKLEEYRDLTQYWNLRLGMDDRIEYPEMYDFKTITFSNGYSKDRPQFVIELKSIEIRTGKTEWGAEEGKKYFVLSLGEIISKTNC